MSNFRKTAGAVSRLSPEQYRVTIGAQSGVISNVPAGAILLGSPAQSRHEFFRQVATLKRLSRRPR